MNAWDGTFIWNRILAASDLIHVAHSARPGPQSWDAGANFCADVSTSPSFCRCFGAMDQLHPREYKESRIQECRYVIFHSLRLCLITFTSGSVNWYNIIHWRIWTTTSTHISLRHMDTNVYLIPEQPITSGLSQTQTAGTVRPCAWGPCCDTLQRRGYIH